MISSSAPRLQRGVYGLLFLTIKKDRNDISFIRLKTFNQLPLVANEGECEIAGYQ